MSDRVTSLKKGKRIAMFEINANYKSGRNGYARFIITYDGRICVNQSDSPLNPTITIEEMKQLIQEWEDLNHL